MIFSNKKLESTIHVYAVGNGKDTSLLIKKIKRWDSEIDTIEVDYEHIEDFVECLMKGIENARFRMQQNMEDDE